MSGEPEGRLREPWRAKQTLRAMTPADLDAVLGVLPALNSPTVSQLSDPSWVALNTIIDEREVREVIPKLKCVGATGIVEYPLSKVVI